jgi:hypothetical protein
VPLLDTLLSLLFLFSSFPYPATLIFNIRHDATRLTAFSEYARIVLILIPFVLLSTQNPEFMRTATLLECFRDELALFCSDSLLKKTTDLRTLELGPRTPSSIRVSPPVIVRFQCPVSIIKSVSRVSLRKTAYPWPESTPDGGPCTT